MKKSTLGVAVGAQSDDRPDEESPTKRRSETHSMSQRIHGATSSHPRVSVSPASSKSAFSLS
jgi:hypothetical protein